MKSQLGTCSNGSEEMHKIRVRYQQERDTWWAESPDAPGYSAAAASLDELRELVVDGLSFHFETAVELVEDFPAFSISASFEEAPFILTVNTSAHAAYNAEPTMNRGTVATFAVRDVSTRAERLSA